jgi:tyrosyl-tRNA synthetase
MTDHFEKLCAGTSAVIPKDELKKKLSSGKKLVIKLGADPTSPNLHLGHAVVLSKMKEFQDLGHTIIFLIGDFTARIGDPTGRSKTRPPLSEEEIAANSLTYLEQVGRILDLQKITVRYNSEWLSKLSSVDWVNLCAKTTLARIIEREDFAKRLEENQSIGFHELLYPLMQGYDSVELKADIELGGTDQTFNLLMGRFLQEQFGQEPQVIMTLPLLEGLDGIAKMSKSYGNAIGLTEPAQDAYGKIMSISDTLMWRYYMLLLNKTQTEIDEKQAAITRNDAHPMTLKKQLAHSIVTRFWSKEEADSAQQQFEDLFQKKDFSQVQEYILPIGSPNPIRILDLIKELGAAPSSSEARRLVEAGAVSIDEIKITDPRATIAIKPGLLIRVGKHRFYKIK